MKELFKPNRYRFKGFTNTVRDLFYQRLKLLEAPAFAKVQYKGANYASGDWEWSRDLCEQLITNNVPPSRGFWAHVVQETQTLIVTTQEERDLYKFDVPTCTECQVSLEHDIKAMIQKHLEQAQTVSKRLYKLKITRGGRYASMYKSDKASLQLEHRYHLKAVDELACILSKLEACKRFL